MTLAIIGLITGFVSIIGILLKDYLPGWLSARKEKKVEEEDEELRQALIDEDFIAVNRILYERHERKLREGS